MLTEDEAARIVGATLISSDGEEVGEVDGVLTHAADNRAAWAAVEVDGRHVLVPLDEASTSGEELHVRYPRDEIAGAPEHDDDTITSEVAERFYSHYGIDDSVLRDDSGFATEEGDREQGSSRDPRGGAGADDASQGHP
jgi:hypothetical protein